MRLIGAKPKGQLLEEISAVPVGLPLVLSGTGATAVADVQHRLAAVLPGAPVDADGRLRPAPPGPPSRPSSASAGCASTASAARRPGTPWSRPDFGWVTASCTAGPPCCGVTTWPSCSSACAALGFDTGRVDGIFGDATVRALGEFQRNAGLPVDGIVGGATLPELLRLESRHHEPELVSSVRARAALRDAPPTLRGRHVAVGEGGGLGQRDRRAAPPADPRRRPG